MSSFGVGLYTGLFPKFWQLVELLQMRVIFVAILLSTFLFPVGGVIIFNDGTTIEGDVTNVNESSIFITPMGLTFPEEIRMENVDSLKLYDGKLLVANNKALILYANGQYFEPGLVQDNNYEDYEDYEVEYVLVPNWSVNMYTGYPLIRSESLSDTYYNKVNPVIGLSIGSPYGLFFGDFFMNGIFELAHYKFTKQDQEANVQFDGFAYQIGVSPGLFIGETTLYIHANYAKEIRESIWFFKELGIQKIVNIGGWDALNAMTVLKENNVPIILERIHR